MLESLPPRKADSHKGDYGHLLIIAGSVGMTGAAALAGQAALRSGAGLVTIAAPDVCGSIIAAQNSCYMTVPMPSDDHGRLSLQALEPLVEKATRATCVAIGPGLGQSDQLTQMVQTLYRDVPTPMVVDADAVNALGAGKVTLAPHAGPRIVTPHPGEFQRLVGQTYRQRSEMEQAAVELARTCQVVIVLKGHRTLIADHRHSSHNETGNPGMATGGSGDVLTGVIAALVGQGMNGLQAALLGCHVHGLAGDLAIEEIGETSLIALDLIDWLPNAFAALEAF